LNAEKLLIVLVRYSLLLPYILSYSLENCRKQKTLEKKIRKSFRVCWNRFPFLVSS